MEDFEEKKILLELEGLKRTEKNSLEITSELNEAMIKILSEKILKEKKLGKGELIRELRNLTMEEK
jgi:hypothetical protein